MDSLNLHTEQTNVLRFYEDRRSNAYRERRENRGWGYLFYELREQDGRDRFKYFSYLFEKKSSV